MKDGNPNEEQLRTSVVYKCLEKKNLILGFEIVDLLLLGMLLCALNLLFASANFKFFLTFVPVGIAASLLRILKTGKPDGYLMHLIKYHITQGVVPAWPKATSFNPVHKIQNGKMKNARFEFK